MLWDQRELRSHSPSPKGLGPVSLWKIAARRARARCIDAEYRVLRATEFLRRASWIEPLACNGLPCSSRRTVMQECRELFTISWLGMMPRTPAPARNGVFIVTSPCLDWRLASKLKPLISLSQPDRARPRPGHSTLL